MEKKIDYKKLYLLQDEVLISWLSNIKKIDDMDIDSEMIGQLTNDILLGLDNSLNIKKET